MHGKDVVVYFFPKAFSPGCTDEVCAYRDNQDAFDSAGFVVLGVSPDPVDRLAEFAQANGVEHDLLSDPDSSAARTWGAFGPKIVHGQHVIGATRSTFVVGADGNLRSVQHHVEPTTHVAAIRVELNHIELNHTGPDQTQSSVSKPTQVDDTQLD